MPPLSGGGFRSDKKAGRSGGKLGHSELRILPPKSGRRAARGGNRGRNLGGAASIDVVELARGSALNRRDRNCDRSVLHCRAASGCSLVHSSPCSGRVNAEHKD